MIEKNKDRFIKDVIEDLHKNGIIAIQDEADVDPLVVSTAVKLAQDKPEDPVVLVGKDCDLFIMDTSLSSPDSNMYFLSSISPIEMVSIKDMHQQLGHVRRQLMVCHALTGCDTTSSLFGKGNVTAVDIMATHPHVP